MTPNTRVDDEQYISSPIEAAKEAISRLFRSNLKPLLILTIVVMLSFAIIAGLIILFAAVNYISVGGGSNGIN